MKYINVLIITLGLVFALAHSANASVEDTHHDDESEQVGPRGGKLLTDGDLALEILIYESGIPPEMRVYAYRGNELISPSEVDLKVTLHRLGGQNDQLSFIKEMDYLVSNEIVAEPHSYEVSVTADVSGNQVSWHYESFEGRTELSDRIIEKANILVEPAQAQSLFFKENLFGVVVAINERSSSVIANYPGEIRSIHANIGDQVSRGDVLAEVKNVNSGVTYSIHSPLSGVITERYANRGEIANQQPLFEVADLSQVWVELSAFPQNIEKLRIGQQAEVFDLHKHESTVGDVIYIAPVMTGGHIARARVLLDNAEGHWRPGMHVQADVITEQRDVALAVRKEAIQSFRDMPVVFVQHGNIFEVRMIDLGQEDDEYIEVIGGLELNVPYVYGNSYLIKADILKTGASHAH